MCGPEAVWKMRNNVFVDIEKLLVGDFTPMEIEKALANNFFPVTLGKSRLRTETAGVVSAQIVALINELAN